MRIEILPEKAYTSTHGDDVVRVICHDPDEPNPHRATWPEMLTLPAEGWGDEEVIAAIKEKYPRATVTQRLPEPQPEPAEEPI